MNAKRETPNHTPPAVVDAKKRTTSDGVLAGRLFERLDAIDTEEAAELAQAPADIKAKHEGRRVRAMADASEAVKSLVNRMRSPVGTTGAE